MAAGDGIQNVLTDNRRKHGLPGQLPPIKTGKMHPLEHEALRGLRIVRRLGRRLDGLLAKLEESEKENGLFPSIDGLPDGFLEQFDSYVSGLKVLLSENRHYMTLRYGKQVAQLDAGAESEELVDAVTLMTEDELALALKRRGAKDVNG